MAVECSNWQLQAHNKTLIGNNLMLVAKNLNDVY